MYSEKRILYHSTNRNLNKEGSSGFKERVTFKDALFMGQAPDGGLFMPTELPRLIPQEILSLGEKPYHEVAYEILKRFLIHEIPEETLKSLTEEVYDFEVPIEKLDQKTCLVRLDRGPTASFKDFAARIMARIMYELKPKEEDITVLVASSGDTGSAVGEAFRGLSRIKVYILYPESEVSPIQKKQMGTIGGNIQAIAIDGKFDDCQKLVKKAFLDPELKEMGLTSANSINMGRVLPQTVYYFYAYARVTRGFRPVIFSIPSGNFGNSLGCEMARRMGLPIEKIIIATNENDAFPRYLKSGRYEKIEPSKKCLSNAMNVGNPSNLARYFDLYGGILDKSGIVHKNADLREMKKYIYSVAISDDVTIETIRSIYNRYGIVIEPHGAVALAALRDYQNETDRELAISLETAHPAKFPEILKQELDLDTDKPDSIRKLDQKEETSDYLPHDYANFKEYLLNESRT